MRLMNRNQTLIYHTPEVSYLCSSGLIEQHDRGNDLDEMKVKLLHFCCKNEESDSQAPVN